MDLVQEKCVPCRGGEPALGPEQVKEYLAEAPEWGRVTVTWWTHKIKGLHRNDFIMAARTDRLYAKPSAAPP